jgi:hypothetical protein
VGREALQEVQEQLEVKEKQLASAKKALERALQTIQAQTLDLADSKEKVKKAAGHLTTLALPSVMQKGRLSPARAGEGNNQDNTRLII